MRIQLHGFYGSGNVGDEAILQVLISNLRSEPEHHELVVETMNPDLTIDYHDVDVVSPRFDPLQPSLAWFQNVRRSDELWIGGGGIFSTGGMFKYALMTFFAKLFGSKVRIVSVGFANPLQSRHEKLLLKYLLPLVDSVTVRNERSKSNIRDAGFDGDVVIIPDPVFGLNNCTDSGGPPRLIARTR